MDFTKVIYRIGQLKYRLEHDGPFHQFSGAGKYKTNVYKEIKH